jgi:dephospho-CoA kinase
MRVLGLTGGIGSGKSLVSQRFRELGADVIDADQLAREVVEPGAPTLDEIRKSFGEEILLENGRLNRPKLASMIFGDPAARARLDAITHPAIQERMRQEVANRAERPGLLILDIPLLYENGRQDQVEKVIVVWVDRPTQLIRLMQRSGLSHSQAEERIDSQMPLDEKRRRADEVIDNTGTIEETQRQVDAIYERYR